MRNTKVQTIHSKTEPLLQGAGHHHAAEPLQKSKVRMGDRPEHCQVPGHEGRQGPGQVIHDDDGHERSMSGGGVEEGERGGNVAKYVPYLILY